MVHEQEAHYTFDESTAKMKEHDLAHVVTAPGKGKGVLVHEQEAHYMFDESTSKTKEHDWAHVVTAPSKGKEVLVYDQEAHYTFDESTSKTKEHDWAHVVTAPSKGKGVLAYEQEVHHTFDESTSKTKEHDCAHVVTGKREVQILHDSPCILSLRNRHQMHRKYGASQSKRGGEENLKDDQMCPHRQFVHQYDGMLEDRNLLCHSCVCDATNQMRKEGLPWTLNTYPEEGYQQDRTDERQGTTSDSTYDFGGTCIT